MLTQSPPDIAFVVYALEVLCCATLHAEHAAQRLPWEMERPSSCRALEHTGRTYVHTPFSRASGVLLDVPSTFFQFPLCAPEPLVPATGSPGRREFEHHRPKTDHMCRSSPLPPRLVFPRCFHTHVLPFSLFALQTDSPYTCVRRRLCVFSISLSQDNGASELVTLRPASSDLLPFVSPNLP